MVIMKKSSLFIIAAAAIMMAACGNKTNKAAEDSDSATLDTVVAVTEEKVDTTPLPIIAYCFNPNDITILYWTDGEKPNKKDYQGDMAQYYESHLREWEMQDKLRRCAALYTKLFINDNTTKDIKFVREELKNPDGGAATYGEAHGIEGIPAAGLKYVFANESDAKKHQKKLSGYYTIATDDYLKSRQLLKLKELSPYGYPKKLPAQVVQQLEKEYGMNAERSQASWSMGDRYTYGVLQFKPKGKKVVALDVITDGDKVYSVPNEAEYDSGHQSTWNVDDEGEYISSVVFNAFEGPKGLEVVVYRGAPESAQIGMMTVYDGKMTIMPYAIYHSMIDEVVPLWKKDIAQMLKLYKKNTDDRGELVKFARVDFDDDYNYEFWLRDKTDTYGAFFTRKGDKIEFMAAETPKLRPTRLKAQNNKGWLYIAGSAGGPAIYTEIVGVKNSQVMEQFNMMEEYGEITDANLNHKTINKNQAADYLDKLPDSEEIKVWTWYDFNGDPVGD